MRAEADASHRERSDGVAVIAAAKRKIRRAARFAAVGPILERNLQGLFDRGYSENEVKALLGGSWLRAMRKFCG